MELSPIPEVPEASAAEAQSPSPSAAPGSQAPRIPSYSELTTEELRRMEGDTREAILARLQAMDNIRVLLESVQLQTNQMTAVTPNIQMKPVLTAAALNTKYHRPMSYDSLKSIVPHLQLSQRLELSFLSRIIHGINRHASFSVSFLKFHQTYCNPYCTTGVLFVDSVEYSFDPNERDHVEIRCLNRKIVSRDRNIALRYFEYFLRTSVLPVRQLELIQCQQEFHSFHGIPIPRLKIQIHPISDATIQGFPTGHRMEMVELIDSSAEDVEDVNISAAHHIKFSTKLRKHKNYKINSMLMVRLVAALNVAGTKAECRIKMNHVESFTFASLMVLTERIQIGSYVTGVFDKTLKVTDLYDNLLYWFHQFSPKVTKMNEKDCVVLRETETFTSVAIRDYFDTDSDQHCISFTAINIPKGSPSQLATTPVGPQPLRQYITRFFKIPSKLH